MHFSEEEIDIRSVGVEKDAEVSYDIVDNAPDKPVLTFGRSEFSCKVFQKPTEYYSFIYDTGTVTGCVTPEYLDAIHELFKERCILEGQGGGTQSTDLAGSNTFGMFRQLKTNAGNMNLISHIEA